MAYKDLKISEVGWESVRTSVLAANEDFAHLVDAWQIPKSFKFYKASYAFGQKISNKGALNLPTKDGSVVSLHSDIVPSSLKRALNYSSLPIGFILKNTAEVYREVGMQRVSPLAFFEPGIPLGLLETLEPPVSCCIRNVWDVVAGARSLFMLAKISDSVAHKKLQKEFGVTVNPPKTLFDHFAVFRDLYRSGAIQEPWETEIVFLSREWFEPNEHDIHWLKFHNFLHQYLFSFSGYSRNKPTWDATFWHTCYEELEKVNRQPQAHIYENVRHLFAMACSAAPGFAPCTDNFSGPAKQIQDIYLNIYGLDKVPTIMRPKHFILNASCDPVYYSINFPTRLQFLPRKNNKINLLEDIYQTKTLIAYLVRLLSNVNQSVLADIIKKVDFSFYHIQPNNSLGILDTSEIPKNDASFLSFNGESSSLVFKQDSQFLRGCIKLSMSDLSNESLKGLTPSL